MACLPRMLLEVVSDVLVEGLFFFLANIAAPY